jgi:hypothetical protein
MTGMGCSGSAAVCPLQRYEQVERVVTKKLELAATAAGRQDREKEKKTEKKREKGESRANQAGIKK